MSGRKSATARLWQVGICRWDRIPADEPLTDFRGPVEGQKMRLGEISADFLGEGLPTVKILAVGGDDFGVFDSFFRLEFDLEQLQQVVAQANGNALVGLGGFAFAPGFALVEFLCTGGKCPLFRESLPEARKAHRRTAGQPLQEADARDGFHVAD